MKDTKSISFADAYGLALIAKGLVANNPRHNWPEIRDNLSTEAQKIADELISPGNGTREAKSAAQDLLKLAHKVSGGSVSL